MKKWIILNWIAFFLVTFSPFLWIYWQKVPQDVPIDITFVNGLITGSGIFLALITSFVATSRNRSLAHLVPMLFINWALLFVAGNRMFDSAIGRGSLLMALAWITASFNANSYTAGSLLILRIFVRPQPSPITPERQRIAKIFKTHIENAIDDLGSGYTVDLQGNFNTTPIRITIEISPINLTK
jgi:hypothetical protein